MLGLVLPHPATWPGAGLSHTGQVRHPQPQGNPRGARRGVRAAAGVRQKTSPATTAGTRWQHQAGSPTPGTVGGTGATLALCFFLVWGFVFSPKVRCWFLGLSWRRAGREDTSLWGWHCGGDEVVLQDVNYTARRDIAVTSEDMRWARWLLSHPGGSCLIPAVCIPSWRTARCRSPRPATTWTSTCPCWSRRMTWRVSTRRSGEAHRAPGTQGRRVSERRCSPSVPLAPGRAGGRR